MVSEFARVGLFYEEREAQLQKLLAHVEQLPLDSIAKQISCIRLEAQVRHFFRIVLAQATTTTFTVPPLLKSIA